MRYALPLLVGGLLFLVALRLTGPAGPIVLAFALLLVEIAYVTTMEGER